MTTPDDGYNEALAEMMAFVDSTPPPDDTQALAAHEWEEDEPDQDQDEDVDLHYGSVDEFVREVILPFYQRKVGARGSRRWSAEWWRNAEAVSRLDSLWRSWEHLRQDGATGMSTWWRDHADYHMSVLLDPEGPFGRSEDENKHGTALPYTPPPTGLFTDARVTTGQEAK